MKTVSLTLNCPECGCNKKKEDFYWQRDGRKVYKECKPCILEILRKRREEKIVWKAYQSGF